jgi:hypothetical protein
MTTENALSSKFKALGMNHNARSRLADCTGSLNPSS